MGNLFSLYKEVYPYFPISFIPAAFQRHFCFSGKYLDPTNLFSGQPSIITIG
jgi:hypothetical protein